MSCRRGEKTQRIHCGIDKDGKNKEDIYKKYSEIINTVSTNELITNVVIKKTEKDTAKIIEEINKTQDDTFKNMLKTFNLDFTQITDIERLLEKTNEDCDSKIITINGESGLGKNLVDPQVVAREQCLFKRRRRNLVVLADKGENEVHQNQRVDDGVHP